MGIIKREIITVPRGSVEGLCKATNVKKGTVYNALNYTSNSEIAQKIRKLALNEYGGFKIKKPIFVNN